MSTRWTTHRGSGPHRPLGIDEGVLRGTRREARLAQGNLYDGPPSRQSGTRTTTGGFTGYCATSISPRTLFSRAIAVIKWMISSLLCSAMQTLQETKAIRKPRLASWFALPDRRHFSPSLRSVKNKGACQRVRLRVKLLLYPLASERPLSVTDSVGNHLQ